MAVSRGVKVTWVLVGSVFTVATLGFGTVQAVSGLAHEERDVHTVVREPVRIVDVDVDGGVTIVGGRAQGPITIDERVSRGLHEPNRSIRVDGDVLTVRASCNAFPQTFCSDRVTMRVPSSVRVVVHADDVEVSTLAGAEVTTNGGNVKADSVAGAVRLRSHGGNVSAISLRAASVDADSSGGDVSLAFARSPQRVDASSSGGNVNVVLPDRPVAYRVETSASGGSESSEIRTDPTSPRSIRATSSGGDVTIRYGDR
jgi:hypothetical protein